MKVLLLRPDKAGDAIKTLPVLRAAVARLPKHELHVLCSEHNVSLFTNEPGVRAHALPKNWKLMKGENVLTALAARGMPTAFDLSVSLLCDPFPETDTLLRLVPADRRCAAAVLDPQLAERISLLPLPELTPAGRDETKNIALILSQAVQTDLVDDALLYPAAPRLIPADEHEALEMMGTKRGRWLGFCLFAGTTQRTHPVKRWEKFLPKATSGSEFEKFYLFGIPSDYMRMERLRSLCERSEDIELCFPSSFRALGAYLKRLDGLVAVDSGPLHLALSLGVPSLGILSGGDTERWFPRVSDADVLVRRGIFNRYPSVFEIHRAFRRWTPAPASDGPRPTEASAAIRPVTQN